MACTRKPKRQAESEKMTKKRDVVSSLEQMHKRVGKEIKQFHGHRFNKELKKLDKKV